MTHHVPLQIGRPFDRDSRRRLPVPDISMRDSRESRDVHRHFNELVREWEVGVKIVG